MPDHTCSNQTRLLTQDSGVSALCKLSGATLHKMGSVAWKTISPRHLLMTLAPSLSVLVVVVAASLFLQVSMPNMTRDVTAIANIHPLSGVLSNLGVLLWCTAAAVCGFASFFLRHAQPRSPSRFLLSSSLLSVYLMLDDLFQLHENLLPRYLGLSEKIVISALAVALFAYLIVFRRILWRTNFGALVVALGFLGVSAGEDLILETWMWRLGQWAFLLEDGAKWLAIVFWCSYCVHTSYRLLDSVLGQPNNPLRLDPPASGL